MSAPSTPPFDERLDAGAFDGEVAITGPGHVHGSFTPRAAVESAEHLLRVAEEARTQGEPPPED